MSVWCFSEEQGWMVRPKTMIKHSGQEAYKRFEFQWPKWAIDKTNELIAKGVNPSKAIKIVSDLVNAERNEKYAISDF